MVNDNEIDPDFKELTQKALSLFIKKNELANSSPNLYNLDEEFAKTKKNKNIFLYISLLSFTLLSIIAAIFVTRYIEIKNSRIPISIDAFEDVNLREIFDKAKQYENDMQKAQRDLVDIYARKEESLKILESSAQNDIELIENQNTINKTAKIAKIKDELKTNLEKEIKYWENEIEKANKNIGQIQEKIDTYDARILEKAKEQESIINNQQKRFDLEMEQTVEYYEKKLFETEELYIKRQEELIASNNNLVNLLKNNHRNQIATLETKYNPPLLEDHLFLNPYNKKESSFPQYSASVINPVMFSEKILNKNTIYSQLKALEISNKIYTELKEIPFYNFTQNAILYLEDQYIEIIFEYANLINNVSATLENKNLIISNQKMALEQLNFSLSKYVKENTINGLIIDPRDNEINVFIDPIYKVQENSTGYVFRNDSDYIGEILFTYNNEKLVAVVNSLVDMNRPIEAFDMILLNLK